MSAAREAISTNAAPDAVGPYSQGIRAGNLVVTSAQMPADPISGEIIRDDIGAATRRCLENVRGILEAGGAGLNDVIKVTVYLADIADFEEMNEVYRVFFSGAPPARCCVQVAALPKETRIGIEAIAALPS